MRNYQKIVVGVALSLFVISSYAIQVNVQSSSSQVSALGFSVNGKHHGGMGKSYSGSNMPAGSYSFGIRINGVFGTDVPCPAANGKQTVMLKRDATAVLTYNGKHCTMELSQN